MNVKSKMKEIIDNQPDDATFEEILRELAFHFMIEKGLADACDGHVISNEELRKLITEIKPDTNSLKQRRPYGLCKGEFVVPDDFDAPLPDNVLNDFEER